MMNGIQRISCKHDSCEMLSRPRSERGRESRDLIDMRWYSYDTRHDTSRYECEQDSLMGRPNSSSLVTEASEAMAQEHGMRCAAEGTARSVGCESLAAWVQAHVKAKWQL